MNQASSSEQLSLLLAQIKERIAAVNNLPLSEHSNEFERIHAQLQQALTNLDGV